MDYEKIKKHGIKFHETDTYDGGIYLYTTELWICNGNVYERTEHANTNRYTGRTNTFLVDSVENFYYDEERIDGKEIMEAFRKAIK